jgi:hypothetical protein
MATALPTKGLGKLRDAVGAKTDHVGISTNSTAFSLSDTVINPGGTGTNLIKTSTVVNVAGSDTDVDVTMTVAGSTEFTDLQIWTISLLDGPNAADIISRYVRTVSIGVQAGDLFDIGARVGISEKTE